MATLNHTNLTTWNVLDLKTFFRTCFGFEILDERGAKFAVLRNPEGFILTLMHHKDMTPERGYPGFDRADPFGTQARIRRPGYGARRAAQASGSRQTLDQFRLPHMPGRRA